jgi:predicted ABC-type ATPase
MTGGWKSALQQQIDDFDGPVLIMLAGINGAGKTTFYHEHIEELGIEFINADQIAKDDLGYGNNLTQEQAREVREYADELRSMRVQQQLSFVTETVFSDEGGYKINLLMEAKANGFLVILYYIGLDSIELAQLRVMNRVLCGGHGLPPEVVASRYPRSLENLVKSIGVPHHTLLFDNSMAEMHRFVCHVSAGGVRIDQNFCPGWAQKYLAFASAHTAAIDN